MDDRTIEIPASQRNELEAELLLDHREHEKEMRRSLEVGASFHEKLSAIDAGSLAIIASVVLAIIFNSSKLQSGTFREVIHRIVVITVFIWISLVSSVVHNFFVTSIAKLDAAYSEAELIRKIMKRTLSTVAMQFPEVDQSQIIQLEKFAQENPLRDLRRIEKRRKRLHRSATTLGYISIITFLFAYTAVMICVAFLW